MKIQKTPFPYAQGPDFSAFFNWGLRLRKAQDIFMSAGIGAHDAQGVIQFPGDPVAQTQFILGNIPEFLAGAGFSKHDIIRVEFTFTKEVLPASYDAIFALFATFFADVEVKPTAGTLRVIERLVFENQLVEYEIWAAK